ncbi:MAG TPA: hypothetical protein VJC16_03060 [Candidatus Nanoarchaeia archaeon]|nr:hypothetical protein [Candidatus Nanoarchaeia archaeon]
MAKLSAINYGCIRKNILKKLYAKQAFSKGHLLLERLQGSIPSHLRGFVQDVLHDLTRGGLSSSMGKQNMELHTG